MIIKAPAVKFIDKNKSIPTIVKLISLSEQLREANDYIEELKEIASDFVQERDHWKAERDRWKEEALKMEIQAGKYAKRAEMYEKQANMYAKEKQRAELANIRQGRIISETKERIEQGRVEDAAEILTAGKEIDLFA